MEKTYQVSAYFPELKSGQAEQRTVITASGPGIAAHKAYQEFRKLDGIKGKRIKTVKLTVILMEQ